MRTKALKGRRIVSQPAESEVVALAEVMIVDDGGTSDRDAGIPWEYVCSTASEDFDGSGEECDEGESSEMEGWCTR